MIGVTLSRWTMSYFAAALTALVLGECLMVAGYGFPSAAIEAPETLVLVHLIAIGWLSLLLCGALFQFVPVLVARPLYSNALPLPALAFLLAGLCALIFGFLQLAGTIGMTPSLLPFAAVSLMTGFALALYNLGRTLWRARPLPLPARFVVIALVCLATTIALGILFSFNFAIPLRPGALLSVAAGGLPLHVVAGLGGWLTFAAMGVSYRLLAMFMLAPELEGARPRAVFWLGTGALVALLVGGLLLLVGNAAILPALLIGAIPGFTALALYAMDIFYLFRVRRRRVIELNSQMAALALISLMASVVLTLGLLGLGQFPEQIGPVVFLVAFGWLTGLGLAKLYKIVAFLTWLECYGPVLGRAVTPRVQDLVVEDRARKWFLLYYFAVWAATIALLVPHIFAFRIAAGAMTVATLAIAAQLLRARLLSDVLVKTSPSDGVHRPSLLVSSPGST